MISLGDMRPAWRRGPTETPPIAARTPGRNHRPRKKPRRSDPTSSPPSLSDGRLPQKAFQPQSLNRAKTPYPGYIKLMTQLFGDRTVIANATGCSSIYGGNLPTTPYTMNAEGRGPAWANSLFEDNAEFGFGIRVAIDQLSDRARDLVRRLAPVLNGALA